MKEKKGGFAIIPGISPYTVICLGHSLFPSWSYVNAIQRVCNMYNLSKKMPDGAWLEPINMICNGVVKSLSCTLHVTVKLVYNFRKIFEKKLSTSSLWLWNRKPIRAMWWSMEMRSVGTVHWTQWSLYFKTTHGTTKMCCDIAGGLKMKVI